MRPGYKYVEPDSGAARRPAVDATPEEFAETMGYAGQRWDDRDEFLRVHSERWILELSEVLRELLDPQRSVLGVGSGVGEHEVLLALAGFDVTASDVVPGVLVETERLFPELKTRAFDAFAPGDARYDDVLITGMDSYFEDHEVVSLLSSLKGVVPDGGRIVFTLRYPDNPATLVIDRVLLPALALARRARGRKLARRHHGWRRSQADVVRLAGQAGLRPGRVRRAAFGQEAGRLDINPDRFQKLDRRLGLLAGATVVELLSS